MLIKGFSFLHILQLTRLDSFIFEININALEPAEKDERESETYLRPKIWPLVTNISIFLRLNIQEELEASRTL
jgi:hypothetical protein